MPTTPESISLTRPVRIRLRRTAGWRMPAGSRAVTRPGPFGNHHRIGAAGIVDARAAVTAYQNDLAENPTFLARIIAELAGLNLACHCRPPVGNDIDICHAAVLLGVAACPDVTTAQQWLRAGGIFAAAPPEPSP